MPRGVWVRGAERSCGGGAGRGPGRGEKARAHRRGLWVAAPHPVRPLGLTHPPRGALLGLETVRGLAAAAAAPQQQGLPLWLRLRRRPRRSPSVARPARAPGRCSRARAASARDRGKGWSQPQIPPPAALRTRGAIQNDPHTGTWRRRGDCARARSLPRHGHLKLLCRGWLQAAVRTRVPHQTPAPTPFRFRLQPPPCARLLDAPPLSLTHFPDLVRMRLLCVRLNTPPPPGKESVREWCYVDV